MGMPDDIMVTLQKIADHYRGRHVPKGEINVTSMAEACMEEIRNRRNECAEYHQQVDTLESMRQEDAAEISKLKTEKHVLSGKLEDLEEWQAGKAEELERTQEARFTLRDIQRDFEEGRALHFGCSLGDTLYYLQTDNAPKKADPKHKNALIPFEVIRRELVEDKPQIILKYRMLLWSARPDLIGKLFFPTREQAIKALQQKEGAAIDEPLEVHSSLLGNVGGRGAGSNRPAEIVQTCDTREQYERRRNTAKAIASCFTIPETAVQQIQKGMSEAAEKVIAESREAAKGLAYDYEFPALGTAEEDVKEQET